MTPRKKPALDIDAIEVEATGQPFVFKFAGKQFIVPNVVDFRIAPKLRAGDWGGAVEMIVGPVQWQAIVDSGEVLSLERAMAIVNGFTAHVGASAGK